MITTKQDIQWYRNPRVIELISSYCYNRNVYAGYAKHTQKGQALSYPINFNNNQDLVNFITKYNLQFDNHYNMFSSLATYKELPHDKEHWKSIAQYDFFLDIDAPTFSEMSYAVESAKAVINILDKHECPFELRFSGKGFHLIIPNQSFPSLSYNPHDKVNIYQLYNQLLKCIREDASDMIDLNCRFDSQRKIKVPYTLSSYPEGKYLCIPITREILDNFDHDFMKPRFFQNIIPIDGTYHKIEQDAIELIKHYLGTEWLK